MSAIEKCVVQEYDYARCLEECLERPTPTLFSRLVGEFGDRALQKTTNGWLWPVLTKCSMTYCPMIYDCIFQEWSFRNMVFLMTENFPLNDWYDDVMLKDLLKQKFTSTPTANLSTNDSIIYQILQLKNDGVERVNISRQAWCKWYLFPERYRCNFVMTTILEERWLPSELAKMLIPICRQTIVDNWAQYIMEMFIENVEISQMTRMEVAEIWLNESRALTVSPLMPVEIATQLIVQYGMQIKVGFSNEMNWSRNILNHAWSHNMHIFTITDTYPSVHDWIEEFQPSSEFEKARQSHVEINQLHLFPQPVINSIILPFLLIPASSIVTTH